MDLTQTYLLYLLVVNIETSTSQYLPINKKVNKSNACDGTSKTALVEQFFNVIFTEFHNNPPICVCVQMCVEQPTYCYPNGCLKKVDNKKKSPEENKPAAPVNVQSDNIDKTMFLVDNDFTHVSNEEIDNKNFHAEKFSIRDVRPDPFKDRYKYLFKYKKMPKVELRYNFREQVKNMKSDILKVETQDISQTRWPKNNHLVHEQQIFSTGDKTNEPKAIDGGSKFFIKSLGLERDAYSQKFFKRDLRRSNKDDTDGHFEDMTDIPDHLETKTFSLETLIDNLLGHNYDRKADGDLELRDSNDSKAISKVVNETENNTDINITKRDNKDITCILSLNMTNENLEENKYEDSHIIKKHLDKWKNYTLNEMITALSKQIDKQNNTSLEIMKGISKDKIEVTISGPISNLDHLKIMNDTIIEKVAFNETKIVSSTESYSKNENVTENSIDSGNS